ncbi:Restriction modification methylase Eco57I [uncultured Caudovirales phage]|uniref:Restriction modification methylase Eco57I n=1 Tax=uncultured Caudovirales phage TaxID=2100421 RepID=A0A6J5KT33_9CAUD|nr:Restriction modification methylase Eco57I [uncultured Caudovirales phage]
MTIRVHADNATVHWLVDNHTVTLKNEHGILYVPKINKLGQVTRDSASGLDPRQAFVERYSGTGSNVNEDIEAVDIFVFPKVSGEKFAYDDAIRDLIHHLYKQGKIGFDALSPNYQMPGHNSEALIGYDRAQHFDQLLAVIKQYFALGVTYDTRTTLTWRWRQEQEIEEITSKLTQHQLCLYAAYTSRGKTKIAIEVAHRVVPQGGIVLVTTPITDTKQGFRDNLADWHFGANRSRTVTYMDSTEFKKVTVAELLQRVDQGELIFVVLTVQDLRWGESVDNLDLATLRSKYQALDGNVDLWIRDERHSQYNGAITATRLGQLSARLELDLTATPYNCYDLYDAKHIVSRTLLWGLQNRDKTRLPQIGIDALSLAACNVSDKIAALYSTAEGYDPRKMFVRDGENFVLEAEITELAQCFYRKTLSRKKNPLSINNDTALSVSAKRCGMWVLPSGANGDGAEDYIPDMAALLNARCGQDIMWVDSYNLELDCPKAVSIGDYVNGSLKSHNKRLVILTCGKFLTGTDIPALGHVVLFDKMNSIANFEQLMGRMIREYPLKDQVKLYALAPGAELQVIMGRMAHQSADLSGGEPQGILDCVPLSEYRGGTWNELTSQEILKTVQEWFRDQSRRVIPGISVMRSITDVDLSGWQGVDFNNFKTLLHKNPLNEGIGSKIRDKKTSTETANKDGSVAATVPADKIREIIQNIVFESQWVAYSMNNYDWRVVLKSPAITGMFGDKVVTACINTIMECPRLEPIIRDHLAIKQQAYANLPYTEIYDDLFGNSKLKQSIGLVYVPWGLAQEMVAKLPKKEYNSILVVNALNGMLPLVLRDAFPESDITCGEVFPYFREHLAGLGFKVVDWNEIDMKFDLVIGNPPYQNTHTAKRWPLWHEFVIKSKELSKSHVALVTPNSWIGAGTSDAKAAIWSSLVSCNLDVGRHFDVGSTFSFFILDVNNSTPSFRVKTAKEELVIPRTQEWIPNTATQLAIDINRKFFTTEKFSFKRGECHSSNKSNFSDSGYDVFHTNAQTLHLKKKPTAFESAKVAISLSGYSQFKYGKDFGVSQAAAYMCVDETQLDNARSVFESRLFSWALNANKWSGWNSLDVIKSLPLMDLSKLWTDSDIYKHFKLTPEEIEYIESISK